MRRVSCPGAGIPRKGWHVLRFPTFPLHFMSDTQNQQVKHKTQAQGLLGDKHAPGTGSSKLLSPPCRRAFRAHPPCAANPSPLPSESPAGNQTFAPNTPTPVTNYIMQHKVLAKNDHGMWHVGCVVRLEFQPTRYRRLQTLFPISLCCSCIHGRSLEPSYKCSRSTIEQRNYFVVSRLVFDVEQTGRGRGEKNAGNITSNFCFIRLERVVFLPRTLRKNKQTNKTV